MHTRFLPLEAALLLTMLCFPTPADWFHYDYDGPKADPAREPPAAGAGSIDRESEAEP